MKQHSENNRPYILPVKTITVLVIFLSIIGLIASGFKESGDDKIRDKERRYIKDSIASVKAFMNVYKVLMSPRCMNCHPSGDVPLQGDSSNLHTMSPRRGTDGKGVYAMKCANCHQPTNTPGLHTPPGNPKWHLPPADMKMVFEGKTPRQLALQIMDYKKNGNKNKEQLLEHARDTLVKAGWNMGEGRKTPPLSYDAFVKEWDTWINKGGYAPGK
jgi:mono/diheme cytochrome c family protein